MQGYSYIFTIILLVNNFGLIYNCRWLEFVNKEDYLCIKITIGNFNTIKLANLSGWISEVLDDKILLIKFQFIFINS